MSEASVIQRVTTSAIKGYSVYAPKALLDSQNRVIQLGFGKPRHPKEIYFENLARINMMLRDMVHIGKNVFNFSEAEIEEIQTEINAAIHYELEDMKVAKNLSLASN